MRIRRLRILGVATGLSAVAALIGAVFYLLPREVLPSANRVQDFVVLNEATFRIDGNPVAAKLFRFPDRDDENENLRLVRIDEASMNPPGDPRNPGLGQFPWRRAVYGKLLQRCTRRARRSWRSTSRSSSRRPIRATTRRSPRECGSSRRFSASRS
ncbi:MAG: hypothetical protein QOD51_1630 [Candidatus Eremiobacteraeota bacterium]|nr:hypothetical protein [Candidatus Eremiobacteraeota bacterium]